MTSASPGDRLYQAPGARKKALALLLLFFCALSLSALTHPDVSIYVPPVTGNGIGPEDNPYFYNQLIAELVGWGYNVAVTGDDTDYTLNGKVAYYNDGQDTDVDFYAFQLELYDNKNEAALVEFGFLYNSLDDVDILVTSLLYTILNVIPEDPVDADLAPVPVITDDAWRNNWLYAGGSLFWTPRIYIGDERSDYLSNFGAGIFMELQFLNFMSLGLGAELAFDVVAVTDDPHDHYRNLLLEVPLMMKFVFKPGRHFLLEPYGGILFNIPFYSATNPYPLSWLAGFQYGVKASEYVFFVDSRFAMDLSESSLTGAGGNSIPFSRYVIHIGIGYKLGFIKKTKSEKKE